MKKYTKQIKTNKFKDNTDVCDIFLVTDSKIYEPAGRYAGKKRLKFASKFIG